MQSSLRERSEEQCPTLALAARTMVQQSIQSFLSTRSVKYRLNPDVTYSDEPICFEKEMTDLFNDLATRCFKICDKILEGNTTKLLTKLGDQVWAPLLVKIKEFRQYLRLLDHRALPKELQEQHNFLGRLLFGSDEFRALFGDSVEAMLNTPEDFNTREKLLDRFEAIAWVIINSAERVFDADGDIETSVRELEDYFSLSKTTDANGKTIFRASLKEALVPAKETVVSGNFLAGPSQKNSNGLPRVDTVELDPDFSNEGGFKAATDSVICGGRFGNFLAGGAKSKPSEEKATNCPSVSSGVTIFSSHGRGGNVIELKEMHPRPVGLDYAKLPPRGPGLFLRSGMEEGVVSASREKALELVEASQGGRGGLRARKPKPSEHLKQLVKRAEEGTRLGLGK